MKSSYASSGFTVVKFSCRIAIFFSLSQPAGLEKELPFMQGHPFSEMHAQMSDLLAFLFPMKRDTCRLRQTIYLMGREEIRAAVNEIITRMG